MNVHSVPSAARKPNRTSAFDGRVPPLLKFNYGFGAAAEAVVSIAFNSFNFFFYVNLLGLSGTMASTAITIALVFDTIANPVIGAWSDRVRSRFGRRHPFMLAAPIPVMAALILLYLPPAGLSSFGLFAWLTVLTVLMRVFLEVYHLPHLALGTELSSDYTERTRVMNVATLLSWAGGFATIILAYSIAFAATPHFKNGLLNRAAYPRFAIVAALVGGAIMIYTTFATMKLIPLLPQNAPEHERFGLKNFLVDCRDALMNSDYRALLIGMILMGGAMGVREILALHMGTYFWELRAEQLRFLAAPLIIAPIITFFVAAPLHVRFGKKSVMVWSGALSVLLMPMPVVLRLLGLFPANHTPLLLPVLVAFNAVSVSFAAVMMVSVGSALADTTDEHQLQSGRRQEGLLNSATSWTRTVSSGIGYLFAGISIDLLSFPVNAAPGTVSHATVNLLGLVEGPISAVPAMLGVFAYYKYSMTRTQLDSVQAELRLRMAQAADAPPNQMPTLS